MKILKNMLAISLCMVITQVMPETQQHLIVHIQNDTADTIHCTLALKTPNGTIFDEETVKGKGSKDANIPEEQQLSRIATETESTYLVCGVVTANGSISNSFTVNNPSTGSHYKWTGKELREVSSDISIDNELTPRKSIVLE